MRFRGGHEPIDTALMRFTYAPNRHMARPGSDGRRERHEDFILGGETHG